MSRSRLFDRLWLQRALTELGERAYAEGKTVEIAIYGDAALILRCDWRTATRDVDAVFEADRQTIRRLVVAMAEEHGWDRDWLNDGVKGVLSAADANPEAKRLFGTYPSEHRAGLRVTVPNPRYLFAMKCRAMQIGGIEESRDLEDIRNMAREIGITSATQALNLVSEFYPDRLIRPKTRFGLEEILGGIPDRGRL
jgi:hypothetical protein